MVIAFINSKSMKKQAKVKICTVGANCKSTCIEQEKNCLKAKNDAKVKESVSKIKDSKVEKELKAFREKPSIPKAAALLTSLFKGSEKLGDYSTSGKNSTAINAAAKDFEAMTGVKTRVSAVNEKVGINSSANRTTGEVTIRERSNPIQTRTEVFHELGHFLEKHTLADSKSAVDFLERIKTGEPKLLKDLTGNQKYGNETAYVLPKGYDPYIGRVYNNATEVYSKGLERFSSASSLVDFYKETPEHFELIIKALR
jgi:hypothetical protein